MGRVEVANQVDLKSFSFRQIDTEQKENSQKIQIFQVSNKFGFSGFPEKNHSDQESQRIPETELVY